MPLILGNNLSSEYQLLVTVIVIVIRAEMKYLPLETNTELRNASATTLMQFLLWLHYPEYFLNVSLASMK